MLRPRSPLTREVVTRVPPFPCRSSWVTSSTVVLLPSTTPDSSTPRATQCSWWAFVPDWYPPRPRGHPKYSTIASRALRAGWLTSPLRTSPSDSTDVGLEKASVARVQRICCWTQRQDGGRPHGRAGAPHTHGVNERRKLTNDEHHTRNTHGAQGRAWTLLAL